MRRLSDSGEVYPNKGEKVREGFQILFTKLSLNLFVLEADSSFWHRRCVQRRSWTPSTERAQTHTDSSAAVDSRSLYSVLPPRQNTSKHATSLFNFSINSPNIDPPRWENIWATKRRIRAHTQQLSSSSVRAADESCPPVRFWSQWMCWDCSCCSINKSGSAMRADNTVINQKTCPYCWHIRSWARTHVYKTDTGLERVRLTLKTTQIDSVLLLLYVPASKRILGSFLSSESSLFVHIHIIWRWINCVYYPRKPWPNLLKWVDEKI